MTLPYKKLTDEEDKMRNVLAKGEYPFSIISVEFKRTKDGLNQMLALELIVLDINGREKKIKDWVVFMDDMMWKFKHLCETCGLMDKYANDLVQAKDFLGKNGVVKLSVADYEKDGDTMKVNKVVDYIKPNKLKAVAQNNSNDFVDDEILF